MLREGPSPYSGRPSATPALRSTRRGREKSTPATRSAAGQGEILKLFQIHRWCGDSSCGNLRAVRRELRFERRPALIWRTRRCARCSDLAWTAMYVAYAVGAPAGTALYARPGLCGGARMSEFDPDQWAVGGMRCFLLQILNSRGGGSGHASEGCHDRKCHFGFGGQSPRSWVPPTMICCSANRQQSRVCGGGRPISTRSSSLLRMDLSDRGAPTHRKDVYFRTPLRAALCRKAGRDEGMVVSDRTKGCCLST